MIHADIQVIYIVSNWVEFAIEFYWEDHRIQTIQTILNFIFLIRIKTSVRILWYGHTLI